MNQGGDRGKSPNVTGTQPKSHKRDSPRRETKGTPGTKGQGSAKSRKASPKKTRARTTAKSRDK